MSRGCYREKKQKICYCPWKMESPAQYIIKKKKHNTTLIDKLIKRVTGHITSEKNGGIFRHIS